ncbi:unnamed protein product [Meganyctiphanes norvegica]|uniref:Uncharacterized protein n=1 Tax=Meganyctiphanes norvegica TaxID=48144 RepID=A0AAV2QSN2_MEGNR
MAHTSVWLPLFLLLTTVVADKLQKESNVTIVCYYGIGNSKPDWTNVTCEGSCTKASVKYDNEITVTRGCVTYVWDTDECVQSTIIDTTTCYCNTNLCNSADAGNHVGIISLATSLIVMAIT